MTFNKIFEKYHKLTIQKITGMNRVKLNYVLLIGFILYSIRVFNLIDLIPSIINITILQTLILSGLLLCLFRSLFMPTIKKFILNLNNKQEDFLYFFLIATYVIYLLVFLDLIINSIYWLLIPTVLLATALCLLFITLYCFKKYKKTGEPHVNKEEYLYSDSSIFDYEQDLLDRRQFINEQLMPIIESANADSYVIGVEGKWGDGKTSILNLLEKTLLLKNNYVLLKFSPWSFDKNISLIKTFYTEINRKFSELSDNTIVPKILKKYFKSVQGISINSWGINFSFPDVEKNNQELKEEVENAIRHEIGDKKIIIVIDDLDRLTANEILSVFQLVRNIGNFINTRFILSYDKTELIKHISEKTSPSFVEKIIQFPIQIPKVDSECLEDYFESRLTDYFKNQNMENSLNEFNDFSNTNFYKTTFTPYLKNVRQIKRILNLFLSNYKQIYTEVNLKDYLLLCILQLNHPFLYNDIWTNKWIYLTYSWDDKFKHIYQYIQLKGKDEKNRIEKHFNNIFITEEKTNKIDSVGKDLATNILVELFPTQIGYKLFGDNSLSGNGKDYYEKRAINYPECFFNYFMYKPQKTYIPHNELNPIFISDDDYSQTCEKVKKCISKYKAEDKLVSFFDKTFIYYKYLNEPQTKAFIDSIISLNASYNSKTNSTFVSPNRNESNYSVIATLHLLNSEKVSDKNDYIKTVIKESKSILFCFYLHGILFNDKDFYAALIKDVNKQELEKEITDRFYKDYEKRNLLDDIAVNDEYTNIFNKVATNFYHKNKNQEYCKNEKFDMYIKKCLEEKKTLFTDFALLNMKVKKGFFEQNNLKAFMEIFDIDYYLDFAKERVNNLTLLTDLPEKNKIETFIKQIEEIHVRHAEKI
ncbi:MAG: P-loop NTPase fold protein [Candidatus Margulisbacteria bacterium]|nr:P-loop NTPase fold protein [Candidatus Margulisiibacteriota bacterium]